MGNTNLINKIDIRDRVHYLGNLKKLYDSGRFEFLSRDRMMDKEASRLIESVLTRIPISDFYAFDGWDIKDDNGVHYILDGNKRLRALMEFMSNDFAMSGVELYPELGGKRFDDFPGNLKRRISEFGVLFHSMHIANSVEDKNCIVSVAKRINPKIDVVTIEWRDID